MLHKDKHKKTTYYTTCSSATNKQRVTSPKTVGINEGLDIQNIYINRNCMKWGNFSFSRAYRSYIARLNTCECSNILPSLLSFKTTLFL